MSAKTIKRSTLKKVGWKFQKFVFECNYYNNVCVSKYKKDSGEIMLIVEKEQVMLADYTREFDNQNDFVDFLETATQEEHCTHNFRAIRDLLVAMNYLTEEE